MHDVSLMQSEIDVLVAALGDRVAKLKESYTMRVRMVRLDTTEQLVEWEQTSNELLKNISHVERIREHLKSL